jgi:iron complex outermembrane receptor protein
MGYVSYSEGFNAGGADPVTTANGRRLVTFDPENISTYEIGLRSDLANGRLRFNASLFHTDWEDIQIRSNFVDPSIGVYAVTIITQNVAGADADGIETELTWLATDKLELSANVGLLDTGYTSFLLGAATPVNVGSDFAQAPKETYSLGLEHTATLGNGGEWKSRVDYSYVGGFQRYADPLYHPRNLGFDFDYDAGDYGLWNARFVYTPPNDARWNVAVFGTNLTDEQVVNGGFYGSIWELDWSTIDRPREVGVALQMTFR